MISTQKISVEGPRDDSKNTVHALPCTRPWAWNPTPFGNTMNSAKLLYRWRRISPTLHIYSHLMNSVWSKLNMVESTWGSYLREISIKLRHLGNLTYSKELETLSYYSHASGDLGEDSEKRTLPFCDPKSCWNNSGCNMEQKFCLTHVINVY